MLMHVERCGESSRKKRAKKRARFSVSAERKRGRQRGEQEGEERGKGPAFLARNRIGKDPRIRPKSTEIGLKSSRNSPRKGARAKAALTRVKTGTSTGRRQRMWGGKCGGKEAGKSQSGLYHLFTKCAPRGACVFGLRHWRRSPPPAPPKYARPYAPSLHTCGSVGSVGVGRGSVGGGRVSAMAFARGSASMGRRRSHRRWSRSGRPGTMHPRRSDRSRSGWPAVAAPPHRRRRQHRRRRRRA